MGDRISDDERPNLGQSVPLGDTGDGDTGVPDNEQGISNRAGDRDTDELMKDEDDTDGNV